MGIATQWSELTDKSTSGSWIKCEINDHKYAQYVPEGIYFQNLAPLDLAFRVTLAVANSFYMFLALGIGHLAEAAYFHKEIVSSQKKAKEENLDTGVGPALAQIAENHLAKRGGKELAVAMSIFAAQWAFGGYFWGCLLPAVVLGGAVAFPRTTQLYFHKLENMLVEDKSNISFPKLDKIFFEDVLNWLNSQHPITEPLGLAGKNLYAEKKKD